MSVTVKLFDGTQLQFPDGTDQAVIARVAKEQTMKIKAGSAKATSGGDAGPDLPPPAAFASLPGSAEFKDKPQTSGFEQFTSGLNEGIAGFAGMPVDLMTSALNLGGSGINAAFGTNIPPIQDPVGGSGTFNTLMDPVISDTAPQTLAQRYLRRGGKELGFGVPAALTGASLPKYGMAAREALAPYMATSTAGDVGSAIAGQSAREVAPNSDVADFIASLIGGGGLSYAASRFTPPLAATQTVEELKSKAGDLWTKVKAAPETLTDNATAGLSASVRGALPTSQLADEAYPKAFGMADKVDTLANPRIYDVEEARRIIGDRVAASPDEARVGVDMKKAITDYLAGLKPGDLRGGNADDAIEALGSARSMTHQSKKADAVINAEMKADTRAATTGTGGNSVNTTRQNIRALFDRERDPTLRARRQGYTPDEMAAMEKVVKGDATSNIARLLGRMAPTSGALPMMATGWGGAAGIAGGMSTGNPLMALPAAAGGIGFAAKAVAENSTRNQIAELLATILNQGRKPGKSAARTATERATWEQLFSSAAGGQPQ